MGQYGAIEIFYLSTHVVLGLFIVGAYVALAVALMPLIARCLGSQTTAPAIQTGGRFFFFGAAAFHACTMSLFYSVETSDLMHIAFHTSEAVQVIGVYVLIQAIIKTAGES